MHPQSSNQARRVFGLDAALVPIAAAGYSKALGSLIVDRQEETGREAVKSNANTHRISRQLPRRPPEIEPVAGSWVTPRMCI